MTEYVHQVSSDEQAKIARFLRWFAAGTVAFVVLIVVLFVTADRWLRVISIESERRFIEPYIELMLEYDWIDGDPVLQDYVSELAHGMNDTLDNDWEEGFELRVYVIESDIVNAFATLGGYVFIFDGLIEAVEDENSLAMVVGHELAHVHHRDPLLGAGRGLIIQLAISALSGNSMDPDSVNFGSEILLTSYSREQELAADELALQLVNERYGHVGGATRLFELLKSEEAALEAVEFLSTHPNSAARIERIEALTAEYGWVRNEPTPYPDAVRSVLAD